MKNESKLPMDGKCYHAAVKAKDRIKELVANYNKDCRKITTFAEMMSDKEAKRIDCGIQLHNIRNSAKSIGIYIDMLQLLVENIESDINAIEIRKKMFYETMLINMAREAEEAKAEQKRQADAERIAKKRAEKAVME